MRGLASKQIIDYNINKQKLDGHPGLPVNFQRIMWRKAMRSLLDIIRAKNQNGLAKTLIRSIPFIVLFLTVGWISSARTVQKSEFQLLPLQHEVTVTLKLLQVYVTDKKGNPVTDLEKEDFQVFDNGQRVQITDFEKHALPLSAETTKPGAMEESEVVSPPADKPIPLLNRKFFLFFDFAFNNTMGIVKAKKAALRFLDNWIQPPDEVGVFSYSTMRGLVMHEYLTTDHGAIRQTVERFGLRDILGRAEEVEEKYWKAKEGESSLRANEESLLVEPGVTSQPSSGESSEIARLETFWGRRLKDLEADRQAYRWQVMTFANLIRDLAKALRYIPGRKLIVLFSSGPAGEVVYSGNILYDFQDMQNELAAANCSVFAVNTDDPDSTLHKRQSWTGIYPLQQLAKSTGGKYFNFNLSPDQVIEAIHQTTACYYVLGYYVEDKWDGKYHQVSVKVKKPGYRVHAQAGYFNSRPFSELSELEKRLHLVDLALNDNPKLQTPGRLPVATWAAWAKGKLHLILLSRLEKDKMRDMASQNMEIVSLIFDTKNNLTRLRKEKLDFSKLAADVSYCCSEFLLPPGKYTCRVVIRNLDTGRAAVGSTAVSVAEPAEGRVKLYPPLLLQPEKPVFWPRTPSPLHLLAFDNVSPAGETWPEGTSRIQALLKYDTLLIENAHVAISSHLVSLTTADPIPVAVTTLRKWKDGDGNILLVELQPDFLPAGEYSLYIFAKEKTTGSSAYVTSPLVVR